MTTPPRKRKRFHELALVHLGGSSLAGSAVGLGMVLLDQAEIAFVAGWTALCLVYCLWVWLGVRGLDGQQTEDASQLEDQGRGITDVMLIAASFAALVGVGFLLVGSTTKDTQGYLEGGLGLAAVAGSWFLVHLLFMLRYARLYYGDGERGIDFPHEPQPDYQDFAYLAYCLGMTYQVSDQTITTRPIRRTVMRHCLLSYALGAVVLACAINLVVQLAS